MTGALFTILNYLSASSNRDVWWISVHDCKGLVCLEHHMFIHVLQNRFQWIPILLQTPSCRENNNLYKSNASGTAAYRISSWLPSCQGHLWTAIAEVVTTITKQSLLTWQTHDKHFWSLLNHVWSPDFTDVLSESYRGILEHLQWKKKLKNSYVL